MKPKIKVGDFYVIKKKYRNKKYKFANEGDAVFTIKIDFLDFKNNMIKYHYLNSNYFIELVLDYFLESELSSIEWKKVKPDTIKYLSIRKH